MYIYEIMLKLMLFVVLFLFLSIAINNVAEFTLLVFLAMRPSTHINMFMFSAGGAIAQMSHNTKKNKNNKNNNGEE